MIGRRYLSTETIDRRWRETADKPGVGCDKAVNEASNGGEENPRSLGVLASDGQARIPALGDSTWTTETKLVCPTDLVGKST